jgi:glycosyltransferase involved in cell wall biosynthesis
MRILHLPHGYRPARGGAEDLCLELSEGLAARGHEVRVVTADLASPEGLYRFGIGRSDAADEVVNGVEIRRVDSGAAYRIGTVVYRRDPYSANPIAERLRRPARKRLATAIRSELNSYRPDVVLTLPHLFENVRAVFEIHRDDPFPLVWMPLLHEADPNWRFDEVRRLASSADALIALTAHEADRLIDDYGADPRRIHVVPPGVDVPSDPPRALDGPPTVLFLGRIGSSKGIDHLARAMEDVWQVVPKARLVVAGATTPETAGIESRLNRYDDDPAVRVVEVHRDISELEKEQYLHSATVVVLPSTIESFGIVLLEAWAAATPVVTFDSPVMREVVEQGVDGLLVDPGDDAALASAITGLLTDPRRSRSMGLAGFAKVQRRYSWARAAEQVEKIYTSIIRS